MRRISAKYAKPGMVLGRAIYDPFGTELIKEGTKLTQQQIAAINEAGIGELFILDKRADDIPAWPMLTPEVEGAAATAIRQIRHRAETMLRNKTPYRLDTTRIRQLCYEMVQQLFPVSMGEPVIGGCYSRKEYDYVHPVKTCAIALLLGEASGMSQEELVLLGMSSLLQNIGYSAIPAEVLEREESSTDEDRKLVRKHPVYGAEILKRYCQVDQPVYDAVLNHHERWNGSGYPSGLKGEGIPLSARIIAIADTAVALVSMRPFRGEVLSDEALELIAYMTGSKEQKELMRPHQAMEFIAANSGELFDPQLVKIFMRKFPTYPSGLMVRLNTGEAGIVSNPNLGLFARPVVRICYDQHLRQLSSPYHIDLSQPTHQHKLITEVLDY